MTVKSRIKKLEQGAKPDGFHAIPVEKSNCWIKWALAQPEEETAELRLKRLRKELVEPVTTQEALWEHEFRRAEIEYLETTLAGKPWPQDETEVGIAIREALR